jgi:hypothetical protein
MAAAAITPRVRLMTVCDRVRESTTEAGVYHLRGVRQRIVTQDFPFVAFRLWVFLVLSSHRSGTYPAYIRVLDNDTDKAIFFAHLAPHPRFEDNGQTLGGHGPLKLLLPTCWPIHGPGLVLSRARQ